MFNNAVSKMINRFFNADQHIYADNEMYNGDIINFNDKSICRKLNPNEIEYMKIHFKIYPFCGYDRVYKYIPIDGIYFNCIYTSNNGLFEYVPINVINDGNNVFVAIEFLLSAIPFRCTVLLEDFLYGNVYSPYTPLLIDRYYIGNIPIVYHDAEFFCWIDTIFNCYYDNSNKYSNLVPRFNGFDTFIDFNNKLKSMGKPIIHDSSNEELYIAADYSKIHGSEDDFMNIICIESMAHEPEYYNDYIPRKLLYTLIDK